MSCSNTGPFDGGTYNDPHVTNPTVTGGEFTNPSVKGGVTLDRAAATAILNALQELDPTAVTDEPVATTEESLPTRIIGEDRSALLGRPAGFIKLGSFMVPYFRPQ